MKNKVVLVTGGTGSLGQALVPFLVQKQVSKIIIYSRNEYAQVQMERVFPRKTHKIRYLLGDIRDKDRLNRALNNVDIVIHLAALKHVDKCETDPFEAIETNVIGAQNLINAAIDNNVKKVFAISTDKACGTISSLYGATKLCADRLFIAANVYAPQKTKFSIIRFGNFWGSSGSVVPLYKKLAEEKSPTIPLTDIGMTRFFITLEEASERIIQAIEYMNGGEIFVPKMRAKRIIDVAREIHPTAQIELIGKKDGEKLYEELVTSVDSHMTVEWPEWYVIGKNVDGDKVPDGFTYTSMEAFKQLKSFSTEWRN